MSIAHEESGGHSTHSHSTCSHSACRTCSTRITVGTGEGWRHASRNCCLTPSYLGWALVSTDSTYAFSPARPDHTRSTPAGATPAAVEGSKPRAWLVSGRCGARVQVQGMEQALDQGPVFGECRKGSRHRRLARVRAAAEVVLGAGRGVDVARRGAARQRAAVVRSALPLALPVRRRREPPRLRLLGVAATTVLVHSTDARLIVDGLVAPWQLASVAHAVRRSDGALGLLCVRAPTVVVGDASARIHVRILRAAPKGTLCAYRDAEHWCAGTGSHDDMQLPPGLQLDLVRPLVVSSIRTSDPRVVYLKQLLQNLQVNASSPDTM